MITCHTDAEGNKTSPQTTQRNIANPEMSLNTTNTKRLDFTIWSKKSILLLHLVTQSLLGQHPDPLHIRTVNYKETPLRIGSLALLRKHSSKFTGRLSNPIHP